MTHTPDIQPSFKVFQHDGQDKAELKSNASSFSVVHLSDSKSSISAVLNVLQSLASSAPRTGHMGDWTAIAKGRAGALDFNFSVIVGGYGFASIHALTMTESGDAGDRVYCPASIVEGGRTVPLPLMSWRGGAFRPTDGQSLFAPLLLTTFKGVSTPLADLHRSRMASHPEIRFRYEVDQLLEREDDLREGLVCLLDHAAEDTSHNLTDSLFKGVVNRQGEFSQEKPTWHGSCFRVDGKSLGSSGDLADAMITLFRVVQAPDRFFSRMEQVPEVLPVISNTALTVFTGQFTAINEPGDVGVAHLHWGARDMAGLPPYRKGYLSEKSMRRRIRRLSDILCQNCSWASRWTLFLLPAPMFMLAPLSDDTNDMGAMEHLVSTFATSQSPRHFLETEKLVSNWFDKRRKTLSEYFVARFRSRSGLRDVASTSCQGFPTLPEFVTAPSMEEASYLTAALQSVLGSSHK
ncbi:DUF6025 family protein [Xanthobacter sp.]|uniref:DUF6025 family protein n=1 Tax=Xanthobacter sp. TaxID=35809 RepID=UPI0025E93762|nr:DUF6025 family protein [Xanthobacter sp.]